MAWGVAANHEILAKMPSLFRVVREACSSDLAALEFSDASEGSSRRLSWLAREPGSS